MEKYTCEICSGDVCINKLKTGAFSTLCFDDKYKIIVKGRCVRELDLTKKKRKMCILFLYSGINDKSSDYYLVLASNRDEFIDRPSLRMQPWSEDPNVIGGRDQQEGRGDGAWLAISPLRKKIGVLLNLPGSHKENAKSRGRIVGDYIKSNASVQDYLSNIKDYAMECNEFNFIAIELKESHPILYNYSNATGHLNEWSDMSSGLGFSNSLPNVPLRKAEVGKCRIKSICTQYNKVEQKTQLIDELVRLLKSTERHLPDDELQRRQPNRYQELSSIFVNIPVGRYGTRTHTLILVTKTGQIDIIEDTLQASILDTSSDAWVKSEFHYDLSNGKCTV